MDDTRVIISFFTVPQNENIEKHNIRDSTKLTNLRMKIKIRNRKFEKKYKKQKSSLIF